MNKELFQARLKTRFYAKVKKTETCWLWTGKKHMKYGKFTVRRKEVMAHRFCYEMEVGPIPAGLQIDHLCKNEACVNPAHLEPVTARENLMRSKAVSAVHALKTHCAKGHPFSGSNLVLRSGGGRACRECQRAGKEKRRREAGAKERGPYEASRLNQISMMISP